MWRGREARSAAGIASSCSATSTRSAPIRTLADIETLLVIHDLFIAIGFEGQFTVQVNNRLVLNGLLEKLGLSEKAVEILRALDKLAKIGADAVVQEMTQQAGASEPQARQVLEMAGLKGTSDEMLGRLESMLSGNAQGEKGVANLRELFATAKAAGINPERVALDLSIARGLDYYTGTIYETFLSADRKIGSVCSGGRYDNLAELFTNTRLPGVGGSLGLDRLLAAMETLGMLATASSPAQVLIVNFDARHLGDYLALGRQLREAGLNVELYPETKDLGKQLKYADRKGIRLALIAGEQEFAAGTWQLKNLATRQQQSVRTAEVGRSIREQLGSGTP